MRKELYFMVGGFLEIYLVLFGIIFINLKKKKKISFIGSWFYNGISIIMF